MPKKSHKKSAEFLRRQRVLYPEMLQAAEFSEYQALVAQEDHEHATRVHRQRNILLAARGKAAAAYAARTAARRAKVAQILRDHPEKSLVAIAKELNIGRTTLYNDRKAIAASICITCGRPLEERHDVQP